jgi:6-pyruvoyltetrahydropterin/6-carboxytetrahydropterin synthase
MSSKSTSGRFEIVKSFGFEAAHTFAHKPAGHANTRIHGHSFQVEVTLAGQPDAASGCLVDFEIVSAALGALKERLDHHFLNDLPGLGTPSLENLARWIADQLKPTLPQLARVVIGRPSLGEFCRYELADG